MAAKKPQSIGRIQKAAEAKLKRSLHVTKQGQQFNTYTTTDGKEFIFNPNDPIQERKARRLAGYHQRTVANRKLKREGGG